MNLDALLEPSGNINQPCKLGRVIETLTDPHKSALITLLQTSYRDGGESDAQLRARLFKAGLPVSQPVIYRHRNGECACTAVAE